MASVSLRAVTDESELLGQGMRSFLNRQTGELYSTTDDLLSSVEEAGIEDDEDENEDEDDDDLLDLEPEEVEKLREILGSPDWLELPTRDSHDDYRIMKAFCLERCEGDVQDELLRAISGRGAFRWFRDVIHRHGLTDAWYAFRREELAAEVAGWLEAHEIAYEP
jgi:hypothetical protein